MTTLKDVSMFLENVDEYVNDQKIIVTYKWLSLTLDISCNLSKRLLQNYILSKKEDESKLCISYLVIGSCCNKNGIKETKVCVVPGQHLAAYEATLDHVSLLQVYSVSAAAHTEAHTHTPAALYTQDYDATKQNIDKIARVSAVSCAEATLRSSADLEKIRAQGTYRPSTPQDTRHAPDPRTVPVKPSDSKPAKKSPVKAGKRANDTNSKKSISGMFATSAAKKAKTEVKSEMNGDDKTESQNGVDSKKDSTAKDAKKPETKPKGKENKAAGKGNIGGFFTKGLSARQQMDKDVEKQEEIKKEEVKKEEVEGIEVTPEPSPKKSVAPSPKRSAKSPAKKAPKARGKAPRTNSGKKASRIRMMESSSEDEASASEEEEEESPFPVESPAKEKRAVESSDEEEEQPKVVGGKRMKRKEVEKTFLDEEGYMVCQKEWVDVTDSEEEKEPEVQEAAPAVAKRERSPGGAQSPSKPPAKQAKKASPAKKATKKAAPPPAKKQASIMNFFKKK